MIDIFPSNGDYIDYLVELARAMPAVGRFVVKTAFLPSERQMQRLLQCQPQLHIISTYHDDEDDDSESSDDEVE